MTYKILTDFSKVKKEKCPCDKGCVYDGENMVEHSVCKGTGNKPIKITYKAGECDKTLGDFRCVKGKIRDVYANKVFDDCPDCDKGKLHPKVGNFIYWLNTLETGWLTQQEYDLLVSAIGKKEAEECCIKHKFLSIDKAKEEAKVVMV